MIRTVAAFLIASISSALPLVAQDWTNYGGGGGRNGISPAAGPTDDVLLWDNNDDFSIISWHPFIHAGRVFTIRESGFPQSGGAANDALVAYDLNTGAESWRHTLPFGGNTNTQWIAWIAGAHGGRVYASRSSNDKPGPIRAYNAASGAFLWESTAITEAWAHDGVVFAPNGDLIVGDFHNIFRIRATDGGTAWVHPRLKSVSGNCGVAATETAVFMDQVAPGGIILTKLDIATGNELYSTAVMAGFTEQNAPFLSADGGTVYFSRSQNNAPFDNLYAFEDAGAALVERWHRPVRWTTSHEHGIGPDGSIYTFTQAGEFVRLSPIDGAITANAGVLFPVAGQNLSPKTAVDADGNVYVSNGWASSPTNGGRVWAYNADLSQSLFTLNLDNPNAGGPVLGGAGVLVVCDRFGVYAYQTPPTCPGERGDTDCNGNIDFFDIDPFLLALFDLPAYQAGYCGGSICAADVDCSGAVDFFDIDPFLGCLFAVCPACP